MLVFMCEKLSQTLGMIVRHPDDKRGLQVLSELLLEHFETVDVHRQHDGLDLVHVHGLAHELLDGGAVVTVRAEVLQGGIGDKG